MEQLGGFCRAEGVVDRLWDAQPTVVPAVPLQCARTAHPTTTWDLTHSATPIANPGTLPTVPQGPASDAPMIAIPAKWMVSVCPVIQQLISDSWVKLPKDVFPSLGTTKTSGRWVPHVQQAAVSARAVLFAQLVRMVSCSTQVGCVLTPVLWGIMWTWRLGGAKNAHMTAWLAIALVSVCLVVQQQILGSW